MPVMYVWHLLAGSSGTTPTHPSILKSTAMVGESGEDRREHIRWTGKYDNISFRIKTPYWHT